MTIKAFTRPFIEFGVTVTKDSVVQNQVNVAYGKAYFPQCDDLIEIQPCFFVTSVPNATYYLNLNSDGRWNWGTTNTGRSGYIQVATVTTDGLGNVLTVTPNASASNVSIVQEYSRHDGVVNVKDFGAQGDGVTDDTAAIQAAINAAPTNGIVEFPVGYTFLCKNVVVNKPLTLCGGGTLQLGAIDNYIFYVQSDNVTIDGLHLTNPNGYTSSNGTNTSGGIFIKANATTVKNCWIDGMLEGILVEATGEYKGHIISNNRITNVIGVGQENMGDGICVFGSNVTITGNYISAKPGTDARIGINFEGLPTYRTDGEQSWSNPDDGLGTISGNVVECNQALREGIHVERVIDWVVSGNTVRNATWWGITICADYGTVAGNSVQAPVGQTTVPGGNSTNSGIIVFSSTSVTISGNAISGYRYPGGATTNLPNGIYVENNSSQISITNNTIGGLPGTLAKGIWVDTAPDSIISDNKIDGKALTDYAIYLWNATRHKVQGNHIVQSPKDGIKTDGSGTGITIEGNTVFNSNGAGINLVNITGVNIIGNYCSDNQGTKTQTYGLNTWGVVSGVIKNNYFIGNLTNGMNIAGNSRQLVIFDNLGGVSNPGNAANQIPVDGTWNVGDKVYNLTPTPGGNIGWVCTQAGTPGTWKPFGTIST